MKVFVTGGLGQIGSHNIEMLLERGDSVVTVDNLATGRREHLADRFNLTDLHHIVEVLGQAIAWQGDFRRC